MDGTEWLDRWRDELGASAALWAGGGRHAIEADRWLAFSRAKSVDYNLVVCHGPGPDVVRRSLDDVGAEGVPVVIMLAGRALASAQPLVDAGWVCIGAQPLMLLTDPTGSADSVSADSVSTDAVSTDTAVDRITGPADLAEARLVVAEVFDISPAMAAVAVPDRVTDGADLSAWVLREQGRMAAVTAAVRRGEGLAIWSMATPPDLRRRGYGRRLLRSVLAQAETEGVDHSLLYSSPEAEPLYRSLGYRVLERWQLWSRPRWVLGRT